MLHSWDDQPVALLVCVPVIKQHSSLSHQALKSVKHARTRQGIYQG